MLDDVREQRGISQAALGRLNAGTPMYVSQPILSRFFSHEKTIDVDQLNGLCQALEVSVIDVIEHAEEGTRLDVASNVTRAQFGRNVRAQGDDLLAVAHERDDESDEGYD